MATRRIGAYSLPGPYDAMSIYEAPDEKAAQSLVMSSAARGSANTHAWTAIPIEEGAQPVAGIKG